MTDIHKHAIWSDNTRVYHRNWNMHVLNVVRSYLYLLFHTYITLFYIQILSCLNRMQLYFTSSSPRYILLFFCLNLSLRYHGRSPIMPRHCLCCAPDQSSLQCMCRDQTLRWRLEVVASPLIAVKGTPATEPAVEVVVTVAFAAASSSSGCCCSNCGWGGSRSSTLQ